MDYLQKCDNCSNDYVPDRRTQRFCCTECRAIFKSRQDKEKIQITRACTSCNKVFKTKKQHYLLCKSCRESDPAYHTACKECSRQVREYKLKKHLLDVHAMTHEQYILKHELHGIRHLCGCGCGEETAWNNVDAYNRFVYGHISAEHRSIISLANKGRPLSEEHKKAVSRATLEFFATDEGKRVTARRAAALHEFHASQAGAEWALAQSERLRAYNSSPEGIEKNKRVSKMLCEFFASDAGQVSRKKMSDGVNNWLASDDGKAFMKTRAIGYDVVLERIQPALDSLEIIGLSEETYQKFKHDQFAVKCKTCKRMQLRTLEGIAERPRCLCCKPFPDVSRPQKSLADIVSSLGVDVFLNEQQAIAPYEIDVFVPSMSFGAELDGLYWHSGGRRQPMHSENKKKLALEKNLKLLFFFEDEVRDKPDIVKSIISHRMQKSERTIGARECNIVDLSGQQRKEFFESTHIAGDTNAAHSIGLTYDGELVAVLSLRRPFHSSVGNVLEIARFSTSLSTSVVGGLSRLITQAIKIARENNNTGLLTYVDSRLGDGVGYSCCGFNRVGCSGPMFWWTDGKKRFNRFAFRARDEKTQKEVAEEAGVKKIFGTMALKFLLDL